MRPAADIREGDFSGASWKDRVCPEPGKIDRAMWEICSDKESVMLKKKPPPSVALHSVFLCDHFVGGLLIR
jgi:hypothetical protein